jgi:ribosomal protein S18 acetylase RimI-like enzyme
MRGIKVGERLMTELLTRLKNTLQSKYPIALMITRDEDAAKLRAFYARLGFIDAPYSDKRVYVRGVAADAENGNLVMVI